MAFFIALFINLSVLTDFYFQPVGQSVYNGCAYTVQTAGNLVSSAAEFTARMQNGKYHFHRRNTGFVVDTDGNTAAVIDNRNGIVGIYGDFDGITITCKSFIHRIVHNFINKVMQTS